MIDIPKRVNKDSLAYRPRGTGWDIPRFTGREGTGNWDAYKLGMDPIYAAAEKWQQSTRGVDYPWLCWNIDDDWCQLQQRLILAVG